MFFVRTKLKLTYNHTACWPNSVKLKIFRFKTEAAAIVFRSSGARVATVAVFAAKTAVIPAVFRRADPQRKGFGPTAFVDNSISTINALYAGLVYHTHKGGVCGAVGSRAPFSTSATLQYRVCRYNIIMNKYCWYFTYFSGK